MSSNKKNSSHMLMMGLVFGFILLVVATVTWKVAEKKTEYDLSTQQPEEVLMSEEELDASEEDVLGVKTCATCGKLAPKFTVGINCVVNGKGCSLKTGLKAASCAKVANATGCKCSVSSITSCKRVGNACKANSYGTPYQFYSCPR